MTDPDPRPQENPRPTDSTGTVQAPASPADAPATPSPNENPHRLITAYVTSSHAPPTHYVICPVCGGRVMFNLEELRGRRAAGQNTSVYCGGRWRDPVTGSNESTRSGQDPHNHWHPDFPPEPIYEIRWVNRPSGQG